MPSVSDLEKEIGFNENGKVQKFIDNFILTKSEPYLPKDQVNHLYRQAVESTKIGEGKVIYNSVDANYLYEGKLMVDPITLKGAFYSLDYGFWSRPGVQKIMDPDGRDLQFHNGGPHWFELMIDEHMDELIEGISKIIN